MYPIITSGMMVWSFCHGKVISPDTVKSSYRICRPRNRHRGINRDEVFRFVEAVENTR
jgi:hypothetical protein